ncbi:hypothetical protein LCGC14_0632670 [marine sediment metagenome]|uniref:Uncharacterized protein n=1 Tax=marine sediment metagenome TaxID=412755 RepID=A0A0F9RKW6_9ZZZZ
MDKKYKIDVLCENCSNIAWFYIPKGMTTKTFFGDEVNQKCTNCNCKHGRTE